MAISCQPARKALGDAGFEVFADLPLGSVIAIATLDQCFQVNKSDFDWLPVNDLPEHEWMFGNYESGRYGWLLSNIRQTNPVPAKGQLGLWEWKRATDER